MDRLFVVE